MCGIAGWLGSPPRDFAERVLPALAHRGPDDSGLWQDPTACLVQTRLAILDLSAAGHQPMASACGPDSRTIATLPSPGATAVATAAIVSAAVRLVGSNGQKDAAAVSLGRGIPGRAQPQPNSGSAVAGEAGEHHQVDVAANGLAPLAELRRQGALLGAQGLGLEGAEALMHQIQRVVDQLGSLFGGHGIGGDWAPKTCWDSCKGGSASRL